MKILWFTNMPFPAMLGIEDRLHAASGGWMTALLQSLSEEPQAEICVACVAPRLAEAELVSDRGVRFHAISRGGLPQRLRLRNPDNNSRYLDACVRLVERVRPDIIHVHGSERLYGLLGARSLVSAPVVVSLQGLLHDYARWRHYFGVAPLRDILADQCRLNLLQGRGSLVEYWKFLGSARREMRILEGNRYFMGRTIWDRAHIEAVNPRSRYFHVNEILRPAFYRRQWSVQSCRRHRVLFTNANTYRRGAEVLIDAVSILRREFSDIQLALAGGIERSSYGKRLLRRISERGLLQSVEFLGCLNEDQMSDALCTAHAFVIPSLIENSPNSLCEAQLIGVPCVASYVGGIPTLVEEGRTGLLFPPGDAPVLADRLKTIFRDDRLGESLATQARETARRRHDPKSVTRTVLETYELIINDAASTTRRSGNIRS